MESKPKVSKQLNTKTAFLCLRDLLEVKLLPSSYLLSFKNSSSQASSLAQKVRKDDMIISRKSFCLWS